MSSHTDEDVKNRLGAVSEQLQVPTNTRQITQIRLDQLRNVPEIDDEGLDDAVAAALALSAREDGLPISASDIESAWAETFDDETEITVSNSRLETVSSHIDLEEVPPHPNALIRSFGDAVGMPDELIDVAHRLLYDAFDEDPTIVAGGPSPAATAGAVLSLAALVNGAGERYEQEALGKVSGTGMVSVRNRCRDLKNLLGEDQLRNDRYRVQIAEAGEDDQLAAADGAGADDRSTTGGRPTPDTAAPSAADDEAEAESQTADTKTEDGGADLTVEAVETEVDELVEERDIGASTRLLARGMISDAVGDIEVESAAELAAATVVAASRIEDGDIGPVEVADQREFEPRAISQLLGPLGEAVDIDIPRRSAGEIVDELAAELELDASVREESHSTLERYDGDDEFTAAELAAGAVMFAATVGRTQVDIDTLSAISGAGPSYITDAMNSVVVSLCLGLVRGDIAYEDCDWTTDLLESELSPNLGDSDTGRIIALAKTFTAGREGRYIDESTLDAVLGDD